MLSILDCHQSGTSIDSSASGAMRYAPCAPSAGGSRGVSILGDDRETNSPRCYLSIFLEAKVFGAAGYDEDTSELFISPDIHEDGEFYAIRNLIRTVRPRIVLFPHNLDRPLRRMLRALAGQPESANDDDDKTAVAAAVVQSRWACPDWQEVAESDIHTMNLIPCPTFDFTVKAARERLRQIELSSADACLSDEQHVALLHQFVNFEEQRGFRAAGALLRYLDRQRVGLPANGAAMLCQVGAILPLQIGGLVSVDHGTHESLRIFHSEQHPSVYKRGVAVKEGLSVFSLCNCRCSSAPGRAMLRLWFQRPTCDVRVLFLRHQAILYLVQNERPRELLNKLQASLRFVSSIHAIVNRMNKSQAKPADWTDFYATLYNALEVLEVCRRLPRDILLFDELCSFDNTKLFRLLQVASDTIDFVAMRKTRAFAVKAGVDRELDEKNTLLDRLQPILDDVAKKELDRLPVHLVPECRMVYFPQLGFLVSIPDNNRHAGQSSNLHFTSKGDEDTQASSSSAHTIPGLEFMFGSRGRHYYKSAATERLNAEIGDLKTMINNRELFLVQQLQTSILEAVGDLSQLVRICATVDSIVALSVVALEYGWVKPDLIDDPNGAMEIVRGWHPLQTQCVSNFVSNDCRSGGAHPRVTVLTGPNMSGKSVYMKQLGIIVYLAHVGSFVPAKSAAIPLVDKIFTQMRSNETVNVPLSAFALDLRRLNQAHRFATARSLILLDEFGRGTLVSDGEALLASSLNKWLSASDGCPHILVSTHFRSLHSKIEPRSGASFATFKTLFDSKHPDRLVFQYELEPGLSTINYAMSVASGAGRNTTLLNRARSVLKCTKERRPIDPMPNGRFIELDKSGRLVLASLLEKSDQDWAAIGSEEAGRIVAADIMRALLSYNSNETTTVTATSTAVAATSDYNSFDPVPAIPAAVTRSDGAKTSRVKLDQRSADVAVPAPLPPPPPHNAMPSASPRKSPSPVSQQKPQQKPPSSQSMSTVF